jgi:DNA-binding response OmpR family regulator
MSGQVPQTIELVVDTPELAQAIARELEAVGYRTLRAADGRVALDFHDRARPDLVVLDWLLPGLNGLDVLRRLRHRAAIPILMLTARGEEGDRVVGLELGADDYLTEPFRLSRVAGEDFLLFVVILGAVMWRSGGGIGADSGGTAAAERSRL